MQTRTQKVTLPSSLEWEFRETTGADDDVLSNISLDSADLINTYLAFISVPPVKTEDIAKLKLRDKYALLIKSRMFSLGETLVFEYQWPSGKQEYEVDLNRYVWDYSLPGFPFEDHPDFFDQRIAPYPDEASMEASLPNGQRVRLSFLDGVGEKYLLKLPENKRTINQQLLARNLQVLSDNEWLPQKAFSGYTSREMAIIRGLYEKYDPTILGLIFLIDPFTGQQISISLLEIRDFFFPTKI